MKDMTVGTMWKLEGMLKNENRRNPEKLFFNKLMTDKETSIDFDYNYASRNTHYDPMQLLSIYNIKNRGLGKPCP
jgi:hypothetical protein